MTVKMLKIFLMILGIMVISGCATRQTYVDRIVEVPVVRNVKYQNLLSALAESLRTLKRLTR